MPSVNKAIIVGNLGRDPEVRYMPSGDAIATLSIATTDSWMDKASGQRQESTEWHRVVFFGKTAEVAAQYLKKGSQLYVEGSIRTRKWKDKETGQDRFSTEIRGDRMQMLGGKGGNHSESASTDEHSRSDDYEGASQGSSTHQPPAPPRRMETLAAPSSSNLGKPSGAGGPLDSLDDDIPFDKYAKGISGLVM